MCREEDKLPKEILATCGLYIINLYKKVHIRHMYKWISDITFLRYNMSLVGNNIALSVVEFSRQGYEIRKVFG